MKLKAMNVYYAKVYYNQKHGGKYRPVIFLARYHYNKAIVLRISSEYNSHSWIKRNFYYPIQYLKYSGLHKQSYIDLTCTSIIRVRNITDRLGILDLHDRINFLKTGLLEHRLHDKTTYRG